MTSEPYRLEATTLPIPAGLMRLEKGSHPPGRDVGCAMEAASWLAGEAWSDHPASVHPVIARVARLANDGLEDDVERQRLWPLILASLDTGRPWSPLLSWRLGRAARRLKKLCQGDMVQVWRSLLVRHLELTGGERRPRPLPAILERYAQLW